MQTIEVKLQGTTATPRRYVRVNGRAESDGVRHPGRSQTSTDEHTRTWHMYTMRIFLIMCTNISMQCGFPGYCCNPSITLLDSNQIFHISILDWNYSIKILQLNKITQEGRKKWTSLFEPHEHRASRDLHSVYDWWLNKSLTRISVLHCK